MKKTILPLLILGLLVTGFSLVNRTQKVTPILNHIAISVTELKKSTHFYQEIIGLDTIPEPFHDGKHTWFSVSENAHLHLIESGNQNRERDKNTHLCFSVVSIEDVIKRLDKANVAWADWAGKARTQTTRVDGVKQIYFQDPDGYWIEINNDR